MELEKAIHERFSVRKFKNLPVNDELIIKVLEAGRLAPSACNYQPWYSIVVSEPDNLAKLHEVYPRDWFKTAPTAIIFCADRSLSWKRKNDGKDSAEIDVAIAVDHITLMATNLGLGTCWVCNFNAELCSQLFDLPNHTEPLVILPIGWPDVKAPVKKRKDMDEIVRWERF